MSFPPNHPEPPRIEQPPEIPPPVPPPSGTDGAEAPAATPPGPVLTRAETPRPDTPAESSGETGGIAAPPPVMRPEARLASVTEMDPVEVERRTVERLATSRERIEAELGKVIVGQREVIEQILVALIAGGHCLITGAPGLAKTLLVKSIAQIFHLKFQRIQFTPDLMPADITGTEILQEIAGERRMTFIPGPIFANMILADEINRTPPKTQSALLEAMQEHQVTAAGVRHTITPPFFVLATQNPIEMEGTYPLPEAQLDRFMFNVIVDYLPEDEEVEVILRTTSRAAEPIEPVFTGEDVLRFHEIVRQVPVAEELVRYAVRLAAASRPSAGGGFEFVREWVTWGAGTRAAQFLILGSKARALLRGRAHVTMDDIRALAAPTLRHRLLLNYRAEAENVRVEDVIQRLLDSVKPPLTR